MGWVQVVIIQNNDALFWSVCQTSRDVDSHFAQPFHRHIILLLKGESAYFPNGDNDRIKIYAAGKKEQQKESDLTRNKKMIFLHLYPHTQFHRYLLRIISQSIIKNIKIS